MKKKFHYPPTFLKFIFSSFCTYKITGIDNIGNFVYN